MFCLCSAHSILPYTPQLLHLIYEYDQRASALRTSLSSASRHDLDAALRALRDQERDETLHLVRSMEHKCWLRAAQLREEASRMVHQAARCLVLRERAEVLEAEAATWKLLRYLRFDPLSHLPLVQTDGAAVAAAGNNSGGGTEISFLGESLTVPGSGGLKTARQKVAETLHGTPELRRCAQVVAWLEALSDRSLLLQQERGTGPLAPGRYGYGDGIWRETRLHVRANAARHDGGDGASGGYMVTELDPDAPTRQGKALDPDSSREEENLLQGVFQLLRAGRFPEARALLAESGQPWRAAALAGCGGAGPTPVGKAASRYLKSEEIEADQRQDFVAERAEEEGEHRALWRYACYRAAEDLAASGSASGPHEGAIFGLLAGNESRGE
jgi:nuclear pore complex protein Nup107